MKVQNVNQRIKPKYNAIYGSILNVNKKLTSTVNISRLMIRQTIVIYIEQDDPLV